MRAKEKKEINVLVGEQIRLYRDKSGMSREQLAELMGVTPRFVADAELGFVGVSLTSLKKICEILGISADRLLWKKDDSTVSLAEKLSHVDEQWIPLIENLIQKQLELIAAVEKKHSDTPSKAKPVG